MPDDVGADGPTELLEVGRITKAHGLRGEVVVLLSSDRTERLDRGSRLDSDRGALEVRASRPHQDRWVVAFEGVADREAAEALRGVVLRAEPIDDPDALWVHELIGCAVREPDGRERGTIESVLENPAADLLVLDSGALVPVVFVVAGPDRRRGRRRPARRALRAGLSRPCASTSSRSSPRWSTASPTRACWVGPAGRVCSTCASTTCAPAPPTCTAVSTTRPFGGGAGMVMAPGPIFETVERVDPPRPLLLLGPAGRRFDQACAAELADTGGFSLLCGRYEGIDHRVHDHLVDGELSIGDVVVGGGEVAAMVVLEAVGRLVPGVMGNEASGSDESFVDGMLEYPQYTRPAEYRGWAVPDVLRSGDHARIARWRRAQSLARTARLRPDLIELRGGLSDEDRRLLDEFDESGGLGRPAVIDGPGGATRFHGVAGQPLSSSGRPPR